MINETRSALIWLTIVTDYACDEALRRRLNDLGTMVEIISEPAAQGGYQQARQDPCTKSLTPLRTVAGPFIGDDWHTAMNSDLNLRPCELKLRDQPHGLDFFGYPGPVMRLFANLIRSHSIVPGGSG